MADVDEQMDQTTGPLGVENIIQGFDDLLRRFHASYEKAWLCRLMCYGRQAH